MVASSDEEHSMVTVARRSSGFTLLELVVAFTILGLISAIVFSSFRVVINSYVASQERLEVRARERILQDHLKRQVGSIFPLRPTGSFTASSLRVDPQMDLSGAALTQVPLFDGIQNAMTFITVVPLLFQETPGLTVVRYGLSQDEQGRYYLGAMETPFTGVSSYSDMVRIPRGKPYPIVYDVTGLEFEYFGYDSRNQDYRWMSRWSGEEMRAIPQAVRIRFNDQHVTVPVNADFVIGGAWGGLGLVQRFQ